MSNKGPINRLAAMVVDGELSATAYLAVVDEHTEAWTEAALLRIDRGLTLCYREVALLLAAAIAVLLACGIVIAL